MFNELDKIVLTDKGAKELVGRYSRLPVTEGTKGLVVKADKRKHDLCYDVVLNGLGSYSVDEDWIRRDGSLDRYRIEFTLDGSLVKEDVCNTDTQSAVDYIVAKYDRIRLGEMRILGVHLVEQGAK